MWRHEHEAGCRAWTQMMNIASLVWNWHVHEWDGSNLLIRHRLAVFAASLRVASSSNWVSTAALGIWTYLTTEPLMKQFLTAIIWGWRSWSRTLMFSSLRFKNWSTLAKVPWMARSFFSSMVTSWPVRVLKTEKINILARFDDGRQPGWWGPKVVQVTLGSQLILHSSLAN